MIEVRHCGDCSSNESCLHVSQVVARYKIHYFIFHIEGKEADPSNAKTCKSYHSTKDNNLQSKAHRLQGKLAFNGIVAILLFGK